MTVAITPFSTTLAEYMTHYYADQPELITVMQSLDATCQQISFALKQGALAGILGSAGVENVQGETQKKLDVIANDLLLDNLAASGVIAAVASEELDTFTPANNDANLVILFDPLDGSSNIDINMGVGTIFSVLPRLSPVGSSVTEADFLQSGRKQVLAGYVLYGPSTQLVFTTGARVDCFTLDVSKGVFVLTVQNMTVPADTAEFAVNMSNQRHWELPVQRYISECVAGKTAVRNKDFNMRWVAAMVGDVHRILCRGGVFLYPFDTKDPNKAGKLRLMYEANPLGWLIEVAGGLISTGRENILDIEPSAIHQRVPVILGAKNEVNLLQTYHQQP